MTDVKKQPPIRNVLLVEDEDAYEHLLRRKLVGRMNLVRVSRFAEGVERCGKVKFDAALLDLGLPDSNREYTMSAFKAACPNLPVVVISGNDDPRLIEKTIADNASGYIVKGVDDVRPERLLREVELAIETHRNHSTTLKACQELERLCS